MALPVVASMKSGKAMFIWMFVVCLAANGWISCDPSRNPNQAVKDVGVSEESKTRTTSDRSPFIKQLTLLLDGKRSSIAKCCAESGLDVGSTDTVTVEGEVDEKGTIHVLEVVAKTKNAGEHRTMATIRDCTIADLVGLTTGSPPVGRSVGFKLEMGLLIPVKAQSDRPQQGQDGKDTDTTNTKGPTDPREQ
ncbi:MAG: hypothetical protein ABIO70_00865 [Pseudomonadota bacterium]